MKFPHWAHIMHMALTGIFLLVLGACAHKPHKPLEINAPVGQVTPVSQPGALLQEARIESQNLRSELGALKILMAKQAGELRSLREQSQSIHHREQDQGLQLQQIRGELLSSQAERDQLRKRNMELEGQVASMPDTSQLVSDIQALTSSFQQIMTSMKQLTADMTLIKRAIHVTSEKIKPQQTKLITREQSVSSGERRIPDSKGRIIIKNGDTLWNIAREFDVSVAQLKEWNEITSDLIMTGLHLRVMTTPTEPEAIPVNPSLEPPAISADPEHVDEPVQKNIPHQDNRVESAPEPKHILSLGSPHSKAHESP